MSAFHHSPDIGRVLVTGATGFVASRVLADLAAAGQPVRAASRTAVSLPSAEAAVVGDIGPETNWADALKNVEAVIHLAARVHVMKEAAPDPLEAFRRVNVHGTEALARQAAAAGVRRLIFVSSIKVNGEATEEVPFRDSDAPTPADPYGISKWEAEQCLWRVADETGLEVVVIRPPMVYGPGVRGRDLSSPDLIRVIAKQLGRPARLVAVPPLILKAAGHLLARKDLVQRLIGSLQLDISRVTQRLYWTLPLSIERALAETVQWYRQRDIRGGSSPMPQVV